MLRQKLWWPVCEAIGACAFLSAHFKEPYYEEWYRRLWGLCNLHFIDHQYGGWRHELTEDLSPAHSLFSGRPDIYHALQACLIPLFSTTGSLTSVISEPRY